MPRWIAPFLATLALSAPAVAQDDHIRLGANVDITEPVEGSVHAAAGRITVRAPIAGDASLAGGSVDVRERISGELNAAGGEVKLNAAVDGDVTVAAGRLVLGPNAHIAGKLEFHGGDLRRHPDAIVSGPVEHSPRRAYRRHFTVDDGHSNSYSRGWFWTAGLLILAALIAAALPGASKRMASELRERPWVTALVGLVALATIPVAAVLLMVTIIGIPIGLLAIAAYAALLLIGYVWLAVAVGGLLLERVKPETAALAAWRAGAAVAAMLALALLTRLPWVGGFIVFTALVVGVGMVVAAVLRRREPAPI